GSALTIGREWSILIDSTLCDLRSVEAEFERLWRSPASREPTEALLSTLERVHLDTRRVDLAKEDQVQFHADQSAAAGFPMPPVPAAVPPVATRREYVVSQTSKNHRHHWWFNLSSNKLRSLAAQGDFD